MIRMICLMMFCLFCSKASADIIVHSWTDNSSGADLLFSFDTDNDTMTIPAGSNWGTGTENWTTNEQVSLRAFSSGFTPFDVTPAMLVDDTAMLASGFSDTWAFFSVDSTDLTTLTSYSDYTWNEGTITSNFSIALGNVVGILPTTQIFFGPGDTSINRHLQLSAPISSTAGGGFLPDTFSPVTAIPEPSPLPIIALAAGWYFLRRKRE